MPKGICFIKIPDTLEKSFEFIGGALHNLNYSLINPGNSRITTWADDGEQVVILPEHVLQEVVTHGIKNIQYWENDSEDVFVAWEPNGDECVFSIYLDGMTKEQATRLASKLVEATLTEYWTQYRNREGLAFSIVFE